LSLVRPKVGVLLRNLEEVEAGGGRPFLDETAKRLAGLPGSSKGKLLGLLLQPPSKNVVVSEKGQQHEEKSGGHSSF
jgi:hypothetical protein